MSTTTTRTTTKAAAKATTKAAADPRRPAFRVEIFFQDPEDQRSDLRWATIDGDGDINVLGKLTLAQHRFIGEVADRAAKYLRSAPRAR